ncbi:MAG: hypothetical protein IH885_08225 [Myxococcales bacterium]|nr:hypothetical protein [Myxococcales bacterium]
MSLVNQGTILSEEGGIIRMEAFGGTFSNQGTLQADAGGTLELHDLSSNQGSILAGAGSLVKVFGFLTQASTGVISAEISGTSTAQFGRITVTGAANLAGTLNINLAGFEPSLNDSFQVMTYASRNGEFATVNGLDIGNGKLFQVNYSPTGLTLTVVETP